MNSCCYILFSEKLKRFYIGACHDDLDDRIKKHISHEYGDHRFTAKANEGKIMAWAGRTFIASRKS